MNGKKAKSILDSASGKKICVVGDIMLDMYMFGNVTRISPEAPVQICEINNTETKLGGAANVSLNIKTLGAEPLLVGVIGDDNEGNILKEVMKKQGQSTDGLVVDKTRPTTCKTRVIADSHHLLRIDNESKSDISKQTENRILDIISSMNSELEYIILQDYNKGVLTKPLIKKLLKYSAEHGIKVLVDPKFENFFEYRRAYCFKPNRKEIEDAFGKKAKTESDIESIAKSLMRKIKCENLVLTLGEKGMKLFESSKGKIVCSSVKTRARKVADVSGAGDTVISAIAVCLAGGASLNEAVQISNFAAGLVVEEVGIVPVYKKQLTENLIKELK